MKKLKSIKHLKPRKPNIKQLYKIADVLLLVPGMALISIGIFYIYVPAGLIAVGTFLIALAFFIAAKQAKGG